MSNNVNNNNDDDLKDEEPMKLGSMFGLRILAIIAGLITIIVGVPYLIMNK